MRVIKFRAKRPDDGKWVVGDFKHHQKVTNTGLEPTILVDNDPVILNTIGQFTGLFDKNGKEIYEGDIITVNGKYPKLVRFIDEWASFCLANVVDLDEDMDIGYWHQVSPGWWTSYTREIEVIGNEFDNHEFLERNKNEHAPLSST